MKLVTANKCNYIQARKRAMLCYIELILMCACDLWGLDNFKTAMPKITNLMRSKEIKENSATRSRNNTITHKRQVTFLGHVIREMLKHLLANTMIKGEHSRDWKREKMLDGTTKCFGVGQGTDALKGVKDQDEWKVMIA